MAEWPIATVSATMALLMHQVFKKHEPNIFTCFVFIAAFVLSTLVVTMYYQEQLWFSAAIQTIRATAIFICTLVFSVTAYRLSPWHPLAQYPGPTLAKLSKFWFAFCVLKGDRYLTVDKLHKIYGPWVRLGPNELSVNDAAAIRPIYGTCFRAPFYEAAARSARAVINITDRTEHSRRIVAWNKAFSPEFLRSYRYPAHVRTAQLLKRISSLCKDKSINVTHWFNLWAMDFVGDMSFSGGIETVAAGTDTDGWIGAIQAIHKVFGPIGQTPWLWPLIGLIPISGPIVTFQKFVWDRVEETRRSSKGVYRNALEIIQDPESYGTPTSSTDASKLRGITKAEAVADASLLIAAGSDTVKSGVTSLIRYIAEMPQVQSRIREELKEAFGESELESHADSNILSTLPYLDACVSEVLRIMPPAPIGHPRYADGVGRNVLGRYVPPGTTVHCPMYTIHRDANNFYEPDRFFPERWLKDESSEKRGPHNEDAYFPFSYGPGMCVGRQVGLYNIKYLTASLIRTFDISFPEEFDIKAFDSSYKEYSSWVHDPLYLVFKPL